MATPVVIPDLGDTIEEVKLLRWRKQPNQSVRLGEPLCEIETDKANGDLESPADGFLLRQLVGDGSTVKVGQVIAWVGQAGETVPGAV